jgi:uncharacterized protein YnzC (UPF0291/DUF896 family)
MKNRIEKLESDIREYARKEKASQLQKEQAENGHLRRTISLMKIIEELQDEITSLKIVQHGKLAHVSRNLGERIKELHTLYDISRLRSGTDFSLDHVLQAVVDFIPSAIPHSENVCARILFEHHTFATRNFKATEWKLAKSISVNNASIGVLEICYLERVPNGVKKPFLMETEALVGAIAESIAQIVEREWGEIEIRNGRTKIDALINATPGGDCLPAKR